MTSTKYPVLKLILCGEYGVGKSSLFRRFVYDTFVAEASRTSTLGFDHFEKVYDIDGRSITLQLWDTGGLERVASITSNYFKSADAALLVFGYDELESFNMLSHHLLEILTSAEHAKVFLCANKLDLKERSDGPTPEQLRAFCDEYRISDQQNLFVEIFETSCKNSENVHEMFTDIAAKMAQLCKTERRPDPGEVVRLGMSAYAATRQQEKGKCCGGGSNNGGSSSNSNGESN